MVGVQGFVMLEYLKEILSTNSNKSSARLINFMGAVLGAGLLAYDTAIHGQLDNTNFGLFLGYCGGVYTLGKAIGKNQSTEG